jgi:hypothetical protein
MPKTIASQKTVTKVDSVDQRVADLKELIKSVEEQIARGGHLQEGIFQTLIVFKTELASLEGPLIDEAVSTVSTFSMKNGRNRSINAKADIKAKRIAKNGGVDLRFKVDEDLVKRRAVKNKGMNPASFDFQNNLTQ